METTTSSSWLTLTDHSWNKIWRELSIKNETDLNAFCNIIRHLDIEEYGTHAKVWQAYIESAMMLPNIDKHFEILRNMISVFGEEYFSNIADTKAFVMFNNVLIEYMKYKNLI